ncbi:serine/threonine-protein kinase Nek4-like isoform X1 [Anguilla rostrata]|uniref:serine/threonine-protein kinase Nek4-like isoform X1 n=2 Tax=Anguilla rostrata TaxID=7938 RepID=UPI0030CF6B49
MESYTFIRVVGKGSYGEVNLVKHKTEAKQYVVKKLNLRTSSKRERRAAEQEAQLLSQLRHPNIVTYRESWEGEDCQLYIVMGFCEGGDLYHRLRQQKGELLHERQVVEWFVQIAMALQYLHEKHILHRDLKTQNIFLTKTNIIKVGDLGIARVLENQNDMASTLIGTPYYMSPELFSNKPYNYKSDVWALGCCVYEMATLKHAFNAKDMNSLVYRIVGGKLPEMPSKYNSQLGELIKSMLSKNPEERPDVKHILRQPYIKRQISIFLEATKEKTAKSKKKAPCSRPGSAAARAPLVNSKPQCPPQPLLDLNKREKMKEENQMKQHLPSSSSSKALEPPTSPQRLTPKLQPMDELNSPGASLLTISNVDIDIPPTKERKHSKSKPLLSPQPGQRTIDILTKQTEERRAKKADPAPSELHQRKPASDVANSAREETRLPNVPAREDNPPQPELTSVNDGTLEPTEGQNNLTNVEDRDDTIKLLQEVGAWPQTPEVKQNLDSTEKLLEPFVPVVMEPESQDPLPSSPVQNNPQLQPSSSASEPSLSRQRRQRNKGKVQENHSNQASFTEVPPRPLPSPPCDTSMVNVKKKGQGEQAYKAQVTTSSSAHISSSGSGDSAITAPQKRPLSARERRRLKQSQEDFSYPVLPALRSPSCDITAERRESDSQTAAVRSSPSDGAIKTTLQQGGSSRRQSDEDDCGSSTSSTDRSEGDSKEGKSESNEMQDLVQLMTQTLHMDARDVLDGPGSAAPPEFRLNRRYRDTLVLHGKATEQQEGFRFNEFPSDSPSGPAKIRRAIEYLRTDVVKGLGVKLLDRVLDIMEEDDEEAREVRLREQMGGDKYKAYAVMVRQLKFFEDVAFGDVNIH